LNLKVEAIVTPPEDLHFTVWAEDPYVSVQIDGEGKSYLIEPKLFRRKSDDYIANIVTAQCDIGYAYERNLIFQGGNILIGDNFWLIGQDYINESQRFAQDAQKEFRSALESRRKLIPIGSRLHIPLWKAEFVEINGKKWTQERFRGNFSGTRQPIFHIDMFITLAGRDADDRPIVLVGDPRLAAEILGEPVNKDSMPEVFDDIADQLCRRGFAVIRTPLPLVCGRDSKKRMRLWYFATSNNALVQIGGDRKDVWLPTYGYGEFRKLAETDKYHARTWRSLGFEVHSLDDFHPFAIQLGAAHCIKKYLSRRAGLWS
jgi:hypothetical protein